MGQNQDNFKRGTAELLVLHLLQKEDLYGYQITHAFEEKAWALIPCLKVRFIQFYIV